MSHQDLSDPMNRLPGILRGNLKFATTGLLTGLVSLSGCAVPSAAVLETTAGNDTTTVDSIMLQVDHPSPPIPADLRHTAAPPTPEELMHGELEYRNMSLADVMRAGLANTSVLRDLGGTILRSPETMTTSHSQQLQQNDPRFGSEAALSEFDAQLMASAGFNNNDRLYNNLFFAGGTTAFQQDYDDFLLELSKRTSTGSMFALRGVSNYDSNNSPTNTFPSVWNSWVEGELRQPLLQGGGLEFNRIAGPGSSPGVYNGVLIARINSDINDADFRVALRDYISNVENAYWDLYLAFREHDARKRVRQEVEVIYENARAQALGNGENPEEYLIKQQLNQLEAEESEALFGKILTGTQVRNGATGGTLQTGGGVVAAERRLRLLVGLPVTGREIIRPVEDPTMADAPFDWDSSLEEALTHRPELQKQNVAVKKRELELVAAKNFLSPRLDAVGKYRMRGFGDQLIASGSQHGTNSASSIGNLATGDHQEWVLGVELTVPIGFRKAHAAVSHAELNLARQRAIQKEQQREIVSNLSGAFTDVNRSQLSVRKYLEQYLAARQYLEALRAKYPDGQPLRPSETDRLLDGERRLVQAEIQFFRSRAEYAVALKNVHYEKGSLLEYKNLKIAEQNDAASTTTDVESHLLPITDAGVDESQPEIAETNEAAAVAETDAAGFNFADVDYEFSTESQSEAVTESDTGFFEELDASSF